METLKKNHPDRVAFYRGRGMSWAIGKLQELTGSELTMSVAPWQTAALCAAVLVLELAAVALWRRRHRGFPAFSPRASSL